MFPRLLHSRFAVFLACLFGLLLLVGTPVQPVQHAPDASSDKAVATLVAVDDTVDTTSDEGDASSLDDNCTNGGMDDILHPFDVAYLWAPMPTQAPASVTYDLSLPASSRLLRPPEVA